jgi:hypothetical protein
MIFQRALQRELASVAGATFTVLFSIFVTWTLIAILGKAAGGKGRFGDVLALDRVFRAELSANCPDPHQLYFRAGGHHAQLPRFRNGGLVRLRPVAGALDRAGAHFGLPLVLLVAGCRWWSPRPGPR